MAQGDVQAIAAQRALMLQTDKAFMAADPAVWQDNRNAAAAVTYVLSGGPPEILKKLDKLAPPPAIDRRLLEGVLDYASGQADAAAPLLADIDPTHLPASMAGQVAIAQSALAVRTDPAKTMQLLAIARLLAPGTLVEEAAIRRQLLVADRQRNEKEVGSLARQYLDRFRHSVYAGNFRVRFAAALSHMTSLDSEDRFAELDDMLAMVEPESRCDMYLTVALASAMSGRVTAAKLAAERASGLALAGSVQEARAKLYHAAALAAMPDLIDKAATEIAGLDRNLLATPDQAFYDVVQSMLNGVLSGTDLSKIDVAAAAPLGDGAKIEEAPIIKQARDALDATAKLIATAK
jgi:chemotaxis protein MotC